VIRHIVVRGAWALVFTGAVLGVVTSGSACQTTGGAGGGGGGGSSVGTGAAEGTKTTEEAAIAFARGAEKVKSGDLGGAREYSEFAVPLARTTRNPSLIAGTLFPNALANMQTDPDHALAAIDESIALTRDGASEVVLGFVLAMRATIRARRGGKDAR